MNNHWIWQLQNQDVMNQDLLNQEQLGLSELHPAIINVLKMRGYTNEASIKTFLNPVFESLTSPFGLVEMDLAVNVLLGAVRENKRIVVYGDYDVDGITSISILLRAFRAMNLPLDYYIPNRLEEGYGLNREAIESLSEHYQVMITVDCGITAVEEIRLARELGMQVIVTDHHECPDILPVAEAVINPKRSENPRTYDMLAGAGVAFQLARAIYESYAQHDMPIELRDELIELAAIGTIADVAPLKGDNRILAREGLKVLNASQNLGLLCLIEKSGLGDRKLTAGHVGFMIGPKINASGRIGNPMDSVVLLTSDDEEEVEKIASELVALNAERQLIERTILEQCIEQVEKNKLMKHDVIVVWGEGYHSGVIGIVASRLVERYHRPTLVFSIDGENARASARSIESINLYQLLQTCQDFYSRFGGHDMAAGLTLKTAELELFYKTLLSNAKSKIHPQDLIPILKIDGALKLEELQMNLVDQLDQLEPYGMGNPKPVFKVSEAPLQMVKRMGKNEEHLKWLIQSGVTMVDCVMFQARESLMHIPQKSLVEMAFTLEKNHFRGIESLQLALKDARRIDTLDQSFERWASLHSGLSFVNAIERHLKESDPLPEMVCRKDDIDYSAPFATLPDGATAFVTDDPNVFQQFITVNYDRFYKVLSVQVGGVVAAVGMTHYLILYADYDHLTKLISDQRGNMEMIYLDAYSKNRLLHRKANEVPVKKHEMPTRDHLAKVFKRIRDAVGNQTSQWIHLSELLEDLVMTHQQFGVALGLLRGIGLLTFEQFEEGMTFSLNAIEGKINLGEDPLFIAIQNSHDNVF